MSYEVGTYVPLAHINGVAADTQKKTEKPQKTDCQITFEKIGQSLRAVRHIPVSFA